MKAMLLKIEEKDSKVHKGIYFWLFFKGEDGKSYRCPVAQEFKNFKKWYPVIAEYYKGKGSIVLDGLQLKGNRLIDADSMFEVV